MKTSYFTHGGSSSDTTRKQFRLCPACGDFSPRSQDQTVCVVCRTRLIEECPRCLEPILDPTGRFCTMCGIHLEFDASDGNPQEMNNGEYGDVVLG